MARNKAQTAAQLKGGFVANPGVNQNRKTVPIASAGQMASIKQVKAANALAHIVKQHGPDLVSHVAPIVLAAAPQTYRWIDDNLKKIPNNPYLNVGQINGTIGRVRDFADRVFKGKVENVNSSASSGYALSNAPNPKMTVLKSGIIPNTYTKDFMVAAQGVCSPMHISCVKVGLPILANQPLNKYFLNTVAFDIQSRAQANVGFSLLASVDFTAVNIQTSMNACIQALSVYYWFTSILSYESDTRNNKNEAMINLRQSITAGQLNLISQLGKRLEDCPIPPRIVEWIRFLNANYFSGDSQGSPLIKTCPSLTLVTGTDVEKQVVLQTVIDNLSTVIATNVFTLLRRSIPQWRVGRLYDVTPIPNYDKNFKTIFSNLPSSYYNAAAYTQSPVVADSSVSISYNSFTNNLDGVAYACASVFSTASTCHLPGLVTADPAATGMSTTKFSTRMSWQQTGAVASWAESDANSFLTVSRQDSYQYPTFAAPSTPHLYGTDKCQIVNATSLQQTAENTLDFLFNIKSITTGNVGKLNSFNRKGDGTI